MVRPQTSHFDMKKKLTSEERLNGFMSSNETFVSRGRENCSSSFELKLANQEKIKKMSCGNSVDLVAGSHYMEAEIAKYPKSRRAYNRQNYSRDKPTSSLVMRQEPTLPANSSCSKQAAEIGQQQMVVGLSAHISPKLKKIMPSKQ